MWILVPSRPVTGGGHGGAGCDAHHVRPSTTNRPRRTTRAARACRKSAGGGSMASAVGRRLLQGPLVLPRHTCHGAAARSRAPRSRSRGRGQQPPSPC